MEILDEKIQILISIGAAYAVNCKPCMEYHRKKGEDAGVTREEMLAALAIGEKVKSGAALKTKAFAREIFGGIAGEPCCSAGNEGCSQP